MNTIVCKYPRPLGSSRYICIGYVAAVAISMTKITARLIPVAESSFFETPRNGQIPRNREST